MYAHEKDLIRQPNEVNGFCNEHHYIELITINSKIYPRERQKDA
jgi:hypothetical protein